MAILLSLALVACSSSDGAELSSAGEPTSATPSSGTEGPSTTRTTESSPTEPPSSTSPPLTCAALECEASNRACEEGSGDTVAACTSCLTGYGEVDGECRALPATPANLEASTDDPEAVTLSWEAVPGATSYRVYRDGDFLAVVASPGHVDTTADAPTRPGVVDLSAVGDPWEVTLSWTAPESVAGTPHSYEVSALAEMEGERSAMANGRRAALSLLDYRIEVDQEAPAFVSTPGWTDTAALGPALAARPTVDAGQGTRFDVVDLSVAVPEVLPGPVRAYSVVPRWGSADAPMAGAPAQAAAGRAKPSEVEVVVEWQEGDSWETAVAFMPLAVPYPPGMRVGASDRTAPADGTPRTYRARVIGTALEEISLTADGWRGEALELGESCSGFGQCAPGSWCPTDTFSFFRFCSPFVVVGDAEIPFQWLPQGSFLMGSPEGEVGRDDSREEQVSVNLTRSYFVQRTPVTQLQWEEVIATWNDLPAEQRSMSGWPGATPEFGTTPSYFGLAESGPGGPGCDDPSCPVERVSWWDATVYANVLSLLEGLQPCYILSGCDTGPGVAGMGSGCDETEAFCDSGTFSCSGVSFEGKSCTGYRLLTEAEWELAARADTASATYGGDLSAEAGCVTLSGVRQFPAGTPLADLAWYNCNSPGSTQPVERKAPNDWGLYDMLGNVFEWTGSYFSTALEGGPDPEGPGTGSTRVLRGGSWALFAQEARAASRGGSAPDSRSNGRGFRLARTVP